MTEWWPYRPADFLMFAPETYWRLFELHNRATWPAALVLPLIAPSMAVWAWRRPAPALRTAPLFAAAACAFVGWSFVLRLYAPINWVARDLSAGFAALALLWLAAAALGGLQFSGSGRRRAIGLLLIVWALFAQPLLTVVFGRPITQAEVFGLAPDPTVVACMGLLLSVTASGRVVTGLLRAAGALCLLWCAISTTTLWTMGTAQAWAMLAAPLLALTAWCLPERKARACRRPESSRRLKN